MSLRNPKPWFGVLVFALGILAAVGAGWLVWDTMREVSQICR